LGLFFACLSQIPEQSPLLIAVGSKLASVGLAKEAVEAFVRGGDVKQVHISISTP
jgi:hypothetical protein